MKLLSMISNVYFLLAHTANLKGKQRKQRSDLESKDFK